MASETRGFRFSQSGPSAERTQSLIVIECSVCHYLGFSYMAYPEVDSLLNGGAIVRYCQRCETRTAWRKVDHHPGVRHETGVPGSGENAA